MIRQHEYHDPHIEEKLFAIAEYFSERGPIAFLLSGSRYDSAKHSFLCLFPYKTISIQGRDLSVFGTGTDEKNIRSDQNPWDMLKNEIGSLSEEHDFPEWIGYIAYEAGAYHDNTVILDLPKNEYPDFVFSKYAVVIDYEHDTKKVSIRCSPEEIQKFPKEIRENANKFVDGSVWNESFPQKKIDLPKVSIEKEPDSPDVFAEKIMKAKEYIFAGDVYQVNLSHQCRFKGSFSEFDLFKKLHLKNPAPFSAFLKISDQHTIISSSPERLLKKENDRLETRPIKGTIQRANNPEEDQKNKATLLSSEKDKSELLMITDLMRNDLGKISLPGTVITPKIWHCEAYSNVFHLLSVIQSQCIPDLHPVDIVRAVFPGGSITGCPKLRAMEIIAEIEQAPRGIYTGSIGYFTGKGNFDFNIAIRSPDIYNKKIHLHLGAGIIAESDPAQEYLETLHKGKSIFESLTGKTSGIRLKGDYDFSNKFNGH